MPDVTMVFWRDIPAQVIVGKGRRGSKVQLSERFEQAIDRCAMKIGAKDADAYLAEWRKAAPYEVEGEPDAIAAAEAARLEAEYDTDAPEGADRRRRLGRRPDQLKDPGHGPVSSAATPQPRSRHPQPESRPS